MEKALKEISQLIEGIKKQYEQFLPDIERDVERIINGKVRDENEIEHLLDKILEMASLGIGVDLYFKLLEHYKTFDPEAAADYLRYYNEYYE